MIHPFIYTSVLLLLVTTFVFAAEATPSCNGSGVQVQILDSNDVDSEDQKTAHNYLVRLDGRGRVLINSGPGTLSLLRANDVSVADIDLILFTHLQVATTTDFPALIQAIKRSGRMQPIHVYGPDGSRAAPSTVAFVRALFDGARGAYRHMGDVLSPLSQGGLKIRPHDVRSPPRKIGREPKIDTTIDVYRNRDVQISATTTILSAYPALAWRVRIGGKTIVFNPDINDKSDAFKKLAQNVDLLIASNALNENSADNQQRGDISISTTGKIAAAAGVKRVVLLHTAQTTSGHERDALVDINKHYSGSVSFADNKSCIAP